MGSETRNQAPSAGQLTGLKRMYPHPPHPEKVTFPEDFQWGLIDNNCRINVLLDNVEERSVNSTVNIIPQKVHFCTQKEG
jgi:hypothetical protein